MNVDLAEKKAVVISDNDGLARVVELNLRIRLGMDVVTYDPGSFRQRGGDNDLDLLVLAISSPVNEPIVELSRTSLVNSIGRVPLLIISDRPFISEPDDHIVHLDFPFSIDAFEAQVRVMLSKKNHDRPSSSPLSSRVLAEGKGWPGNVLAGANE